MDICKMRDTLIELTNRYFDPDMINDDAFVFLLHMETDDLKNIQDYWLGIDAGIRDIINYRNDMEALNDEAEQP